VTNSKINPEYSSDTNYSNVAIPSSIKKKKNKPYVIDKKEIPNDKNAYIYRNPRNGHKWCLYFYDRVADTRHRIVLVDKATGTNPPPTTDAQTEAWIIGIAKYVELKEKSIRGESINSITFKELCDKFLRKEAARVSEIPHRGITKVRYRLIKSQIKWIRSFVNNDKIMIHRIHRNAFNNYLLWRVEKAREYGKDTPVQATLNSEISTLGRLFKEVAVANGYLTEATMPLIPKTKRNNRDKKPRRDSFTEREWNELEKVARLYWIKGKSRILDEEYTIEKDKTGQYKTVNTISKISQRGRNNITHRIMFYNAMRISMETGMRVGSLKKLKWKHIDRTAVSSVPNTPKTEKIMNLSINVPAENNKTGSSYRLTAPIAVFIENLWNVVNRETRKMDDFVFTNQSTGKQWSSRIWEDYLMELLVEARLADWNLTTKQGQGNKRIVIHSGKTLTYYSFRHTYITFRLNAGVPLAIVASNCNTSMQYIQDHYYHYQSDKNIDILTKGREKYIKAARGTMDWINAIETKDQS